MRIALIPVLAFLGTFSVLLSDGRAEADPVTFPHSFHQNLFLDCQGCHLGAFEEDQPLVSVTENECARCHNGKVVEPMDWKPTPLTFANLKFVHYDHASFLDCEECHSKDLDGDFKPFTRQTCFDCHDIEEHLSMDNDCSMCHFPLGESHWTDEQVSGLPHPPSHESDSWVRDHGDFVNDRGPQQCAVCHSRETCTRCHRSGPAMQAIQSLAPRKTEP